MTQDEITSDVPGRDGRRSLERVVQNLASQAHATGRDAAASLLEAIGLALVAQRATLSVEG